MKDFSIAIAAKAMSDEAAEKAALEMWNDEKPQESREFKEEFNKAEIEKVVFDALVELTSRHTALISKSVILNGNLQVDSTEQVGNNIRVSKEVSREVLGNVSSVLRSVYERTREYMKTHIGDSKESGESNES